MGRFDEDAVVDHKFSVSDDLSFAICMRCEAALRREVPVDLPTHEPPPPWETFDGTPKCPGPKKAKKKE